MSIIALIPARAGSQRIKDKNIKPLAGHPLIAYTVAAAEESGIFAAIAVSSDSPEILDIARDYGRVARIRRKPAHATSDSPDVEWLADLFQKFTESNAPDVEYFAILRPTSPFRSAKTIQRAWNELSRSACDSLRAVQQAKEHPGKQWFMQNCELVPILQQGGLVPWHSRPTQTLPPVYTQNASLEMAKCSLVRDRLYPSITGERIWGFINPEPEGFDLNTPDDWDYAEWKISKGEWTLPCIG